MIWQNQRNVSTSNCVEFVTLASKTFQIPAERFKILFNNHPFGDLQELSGNWIFAPVQQNSSCIPKMPLKDILLTIVTEKQENLLDQPNNIHLKRTSQLDDRKTDSPEASSLEEDEISTTFIVEMGLLLVGLLCFLAWCFISPAKKRKEKTEPENA